jgi:hypothetical protein
MVVTPEAARELGIRLAGADAIYFPVRHHSPACAWQLRRLIEQSPPSAILVEGPRDFTPMIPLLAHPEARLPLAIYTYSVFKAAGVDAPIRRAAYYPFCDYSPELVALREANARGIPSRFVDLNFSEQCQVETQPEDHEAVSLLEELHFGRSRYLFELARRQGCRDHQELWEHLFEIRVTERSVTDHIAGVAAYCHLARVECSPEELHREGTLKREAEMAWHVQQALAAKSEGTGPILVVLGGFHAVVMPSLVSGSVVRPRISTTGVSDESAALIRYSYDRLDRLNGYSAGMTSPAWHQRVWETLQSASRRGRDLASARREMTLDVLSEIAAELRDRHDVGIPVSTLQGAYEHALRLAALRNRPAPAREDVLDAVTSCFVKGDVDSDGALIRAVTGRQLTGKVLGRVPPGAGTPPLVRDFDYRARRQRLKIDDSTRHRAVLDIYRRPDHRATSRLLHGLAFLGVPLGVRTAGPDFVAGIGLDRLQEHWDYAYSAATEAALVEASVYGNTVSLAVATRYLAKLDGFESASETHDASVAASLLVQALVLGLHDHVARSIGIVARAIASDARFASVARAAGSLGLVWESREPLEARDAPEIPDVMRASYERAIFLGATATDGADEGREIVDGLLRLRELTMSQAGADLDGHLFWSMVRDLQGAHASALMRGAATGLGYGAGRVSDAELATALKGHLDGMLGAVDAVAFLRGLLSTAREAAWQQPSLLEVIDTLLGRWEDSQFVALLPELRLAFAELTPKETDRVADAVAQLHGQGSLGRLVRHDISAEQVQANLLASQTLLDVLRTDGLGRWLRP